MKRLILIPLLLFCLTAFGQFTKPELYNGINLNIRNKGASQKRLADMLDSIVVSMGSGGGSSLTLVNGNGTTVNGTGDGVDLGGTLTGDVEIDGDNTYSLSSYNLSSFQLQSINDSEITSGGNLTFDVTNDILLAQKPPTATLGDILTRDTSTGALEKLGIGSGLSISSGNLVASGGITISTTPITGGASGRLLTSGTTVGELALGTGISTWLGAPSWTNFNSAITGTAPFIKTTGTSSLTGNILVAGSGSNYNFVFGSTGSGEIGSFEILANQIKIDYSSTNATGDTYYRNSSGYFTRLAAGTNGHVLTLAGGIPSWAAPSGLTVGTSTITSGTNTKVLYNNSGVLGEYTVSGTGNVALTTSPTFTTPNIGTATGTASGNYSLASGGTATGTNTFAMGSNPFILTSGVTTGTGATAGIQNVFNSLTTGNGLDISTSSLTTGKGLALTSTSTAINHTRGTNALFSSRISGANANSTRTAIAGEFVATNTGTSSTNTAVYAAASGGTNNYSIYASGQMYVEGIASSGYVAWFKASGVNQGIYISSTGHGVIPLSNNTTDLGNTSQQFKNAFLYGNIAAGGITTVLARIHSRGAGTTTGYNLLTENSGATARFGVRDNGAIEFSGTAGTAGQLLYSGGGTAPPTWEEGIRTVKVTLSSAELLNSFSAAKQLIAAPGAGKVNEVISITMRYNYLTAPYVTNTTLAVYYSTVEVAAHTGVLDQLASVIKVASPGIGFVSASADLENQAVFIGTKTGNPTAGSGTLDVYVTYRIITL